MPAAHDAEALSFLNSAVQHLARYVESHCPRAERQARMALDRLECIAPDADLDAACVAIETLLDRAGRV